MCIQTNKQHQQDGNFEEKLHFLELFWSLVFHTSYMLGIKHPFVFHNATFPSLLTGTMHNTANNLTNDMKAVEVKAHSPFTRGANGCKSSVFPRCFH